MSWAALSTIWAKGASFFAQIVLGYLLTSSDWGTYAIAISVAAFVMTFRDGGVRELLVHRGAADYESLRGPVFWLALLINVGIAAVLALIAIVAADFYEQPALKSLIWILAVAVVLDTPGQLLRAKLRIELRFATYARLTVASATLRYGGAIVLAWQGHGAMSFVLPLPFIAVLEWVVLTLLTRDILFRSRPSLATWPSLLGEVKWLLLGTVTTVFATMGDYVVLGRLVPAAVVGTYYFAFQLAVHGSMLAAANVNTVLMPTLVRVGPDGTRQRRATLRALRSLALIASPLSLGLAAVIDPLETAIWGGRWKQAIGAVQILGVMLPIRLSFMIATSSLKARGAFRLWALLSLSQGLGLMLVALVAGLLMPDATRIAMLVAGYWLVASPLALYSALRELAGVRDLVASLLPSWTISLASLAIAIALDRLGVEECAPVVRVGVLGGAFAVVFLSLSRTLNKEHLSDTVSILPVPLRKPLTKLLRLWEPGFQKANGPNGK
jgi:O-antigen/teichoic acid export membrane protein